MKIRPDRMISLPIKARLSLIYTCSLLIAIFMAVVSVIGLRYRAITYTTENLLRTFVANDVVNLFFGLPLLLGSMTLAWRGKWIGLLCWPGALLVVLYNYTAYVLAAPFSWVFPFYLALAVLSLYTLIGLVASIDGKIAQQRLSRAVHEKFAGGVLTGYGLLFFLRVVIVLVSALVRGVSVAETDLAVSVSDFLVSPAMIVGGILLWRHKELGYVTGLGLLFQLSMLFIALIFFLLLQPYLTGAPFALADVLVVFVMGLIGFVAFALFARGVMAKSN